ncbi:MAG: restriction endonuclease [Nitrososphaerales archaeon]
MSEDWKVAKGTALEDIVAGLLKSWGFDTQTRVRAKDKSEVEHEIDVLGRRKEAFGEFTLAVECKNHSQPIDIKEVRNFRDKLNSLGYSKGLFVSSKGFTPPALQYAESVGIETWNDHSLTANLAKQTSTDVLIQDAIEPHHELDTYAIPHLLNSSKLRVADSTVSYSPYYFVRYHCFAQQWVNFQLTNLESKGLVVVDGTTGAIVDYSADSGVVGSLKQTRSFASCESAPLHDIPEQKLARRFRQVKHTRPRVAESEARQIAQLELAKSIQSTHNYTTGRGKYVRHETKTVRPKISEIRIISVKIANVPLVTVSMTYAGRMYTRYIQAATIRFLSDDFWFCNIDANDRKPPVALCEECGGLACKDHARLCQVCGKRLCTTHSGSKGLLQKKVYCRVHAPGKAKIPEYHAPPEPQVPETSGRAIAPEPPRTESQVPEASGRAIAPEPPRTAPQVQQGGTCIRCGKGVPFNPNKPFCIDCYRVWAEFKNAEYSEKYCHSCGKRTETSFAKPLCMTCWRRSAGTKRAHAREGLTQV